MSITQVIEIYDGTRENSRTGSQRSGVRIFLVPADPDQALLYPGVPTTEDKHNFNGVSLPVQSYAVESTVRSGVSKVTVTYGSSSFSGANTVVDDTEPSFKAYELSFTETEIPLPFFRARLLTSRTEQNDLIEKYVWEPQDVRIKRTRLILTVRVNVDTFTLSDIGNIVNQQNKVHTFGSRKWVYQGGNATLEQFVGGGEPATRWQIQHTWWINGEVASPTITTSDPLETFPQTKLPALFEWLVRPQLAEDFNGTSPPTITTIFPYEEIPNGYTLLPGRPI